MPKFKALLARYEQQFAEEAGKTGIANKNARLRKLDRHAKRIEQIAEERAKDLEMLAVAGGSTGFITRDVKTVGSGPLAQVIDVYEFDAALSKEYREVLRQAAQELGGAFDAKDAQVVVNQQFVMIPADKSQPVAPLIPANAITIG